MAFRLACGAGLAGASPRGAGLQRTNPAGDVFRSFSAVLPFAGASGAVRPTLSMTPVQSSDTLERYHRPITLDGLALYAETSWPVATVFRLCLEGMNGQTLSKQ